MSQHSCAAAATPRLSCHKLVSAAVEQSANTQKHSLGMCAAAFQNAAKATEDLTHLTKPVTLRNQGLERCNAASESTACHVDAKKLETQMASPVSKHTLTTPSGCATPIPRTLFRSHYREGKDQKQDERWCNCIIARASAGSYIDTFCFERREPALNNFASINRKQRHPSRSSMRPVRPVQTSRHAFV